MLQLSCPRTLGTEGRRRCEAARETGTEATIAGYVGYETERGTKGSNGSEPSFYQEFERLRFESTRCAFDWGERLAAVDVPATVQTTTSRIRPWELLRNRSSALDRPMILRTAKYNVVPGYTGCVRVSSGRLPGH